MRKWVLLGILLIVLPGCRETRMGSLTTASRGFVPELPVPSRPKLAGMTAEEQKTIKEKVPEPIVKKISDNFSAMHLYTKKLEITITEYNRYAEQNNEAVREELGFPKFKKKKEEEKE